MSRWIVLRLVGPMASFGGEMVDARGVTRDFPAASALTGLLANALGYERFDGAKLARLQERLVFAVRRDHEPAGGRFTDFQTAKLGGGDKGWTTRGGVEGRDGGASTYDSPHIRSRDHHADAMLTAVLRLSPEDESPTLDDIRQALNAPARPLFLGRKPCLPSRPICEGEIEADGARAALALPAPLDRPGAMRALWPAEEGAEGADLVDVLTDERDWISGVHAGARRVAMGRVVVGRGGAR